MSPVSLTGFVAHHHGPHLRYLKTIGPNNASDALKKPTIGGTRYKEVKNAMLAAPAAREWKGGIV
jgi:hypothetical protein